MPTGEAPGPPHPQEYFLHSFPFPTPVLLHLFLISCGTGRSVGNHSFAFEMTGASDDELELIEKIPERNHSSLNNFCIYLLPLSHDSFRIQTRSASWSLGRLGRRDARAWRRIDSSLRRPVSCGSPLRGLFTLLRPETTTKSRSPVRPYKSSILPTRVTGLPARNEGTFGLLRRYKGGRGDE